MCQFIEAKVYFKSEMMVKGTELDHPEFMDKGPMSGVYWFHMEAHTV